MATTYLLASFQEDQARLAPHLQAYLGQETDERMIACLFLSLGQTASCQSRLLCLAHALSDCVKRAISAALCCYGAFLPHERSDP